MFKVFSVSLNNIQYNNAIEDFGLFFLFAKFYLWFNGEFSFRTHDGEKKRRRPWQRSFIETLCENQLKKGLGTTCFKFKFFITTFTLASFYKNFYTTCRCYAPRDRIPPFQLMRGQNYSFGHTPSIEQSNRDVL